jgi:DNA polymerase III delta prime subunit
MQLLLHPISQKRYDAYIHDMPQSILLVASAGSGKETILRQLSTDILGEHATGRLYEITALDDKKSISIDAIRELKVSLRLKSDKKRVVLIPHAEQLTTEAQNSILKLLEEPPENVHFLLAVTKLGDVLDTIQSRTSVWRLTSPTKLQIQTYFKQYPSQQVDKALAIAEARTGLIVALLDDEQNHDLLYSIEIAKEILQESHFNRLIRVDSLSKDSAQSKMLLDALSLICKAALDHAASKQLQSVKQWHRRLTLVTAAQQEIMDNVQTKLVLSHLFMVL